MFWHCQEFSGGNACAETSCPGVGRQDPINRGSALWGRPLLGGVGGGGAGEHLSYLVEHVLRELGPP